MKDSKTLKFVKTALLLIGFAFGTTTVVSKPADPELISVPSGSFVPLFPEGKTEKPSLEVFNRISVNTFKIQKYPVTNSQFLAFVLANPEWQRSEVDPLFAGKEYLRLWKSEVSFDPQIESSPVVFVSWFAAASYCQQLNTRLPTTVEWEYLASLPLMQNRKVVTTEQKNRLILEWYGVPSDENGPGHVGARENQLGIFDLFGLIWEWTYDFNSALMTTDNRSNSDEKNGLFCGGGAVGSNSPEDYAAFMRYAFRSSLKGNYSGVNLGFRCVQ